MKQLIARIILFFNNRVIIRKQASRILHLKARNTAAIKRIHGQDAVLRTLEDEIHFFDGKVEFQTQELKQKDLKIKKLKARIKKS